MKIPVTINFDKREPIGMLTLRDDVEVTDDFMFACAFRVSPDGKQTLVEVSLVPEPAQSKSDAHAEEKAE